MVRDLRDDTSSTPEVDSVRLYVRVPEVTARELAQLHDTLLKHPGPCTVFLHLLKSDGSETVVELPSRFKVACTAELLGAVEELFGKRIASVPVQH
jgi:hypothetical protein